MPSYLASTLRSCFFFWTYVFLSSHFLDYCSRERSNILHLCCSWIFTGIVQWLNLSSKKWTRIFLSLSWMRGVCLYSLKLHGLLASMFHHPCQKLIMMCIKHQTSSSSNHNKENSIQKTTQPNILLIFVPSSLISLLNSSIWSIHTSTNSSIWSGFGGI